MIEFKGMDELIKKLQTLSGEQGREAVRKALLATANDARTEMVINCPVKTARLRSSIHVETPSNQVFTYSSSEGQFDGGFNLKLQDLEAAVGTNVEYANEVNYGTKPHTIIPVNKKALFWKGANHPVKKVNHPGTKGQFFFEKGVAKAEQVVESHLKKFIDNELRS